MNLLSYIVLGLAFSILVGPINVVKRGTKKFGFGVSFAYQAVTTGLELLISH